MKIEYYSKPNCPFCDKLNNYLKLKNLEATKYILDVDFNREKLLEAVPTAKTFPVVIIDGKHIGGYTEFVELFEEKELF